MTKILVVAHEKYYCTALARALTRRGFQVETATGGREAIDLGVWFQPDVLATDWSLSQIHGRKVAETLRLVKPNLSLILMTDFCSPHLELEAWRQGAFALLEKPFKVEQMLNAVAAATTQPVIAHPASVAVLGTSIDGEIMFTNAKARELLTSTLAGSGAGRIHEVLDRDARYKLHDATEEWQEVEALADRPVAWQVRARSAPGTPGRLIVLLEGEQFLAQPDARRRYYDNEVLVRLLLDIPADHQPCWPFAFESRVLLIDGSDMFRDLAAAEIERAGAIWHPAGSAADAFKILRRDPHIKVIIIDDQMIANSAGLIEKLWDSRPEVVIVGQSLSNSQDVFTTHGVDRVLHKPWEVEELIQVLKPSASTPRSSYGARSPAGGAALN